MHNLCVLVIDLKLKLLYQSSRLELPELTVLSLNSCRLLTHLLTFRPGAARREILYLQAEGEDG